MPNRIIREAILSSEKMALLGWPEEVFYRRLMSIVDDYGRTEGNHQLLRSRCYPLQTDTVRVADITRWMAACQKAGLILDYAVEGKQYVEVINFGQQQRSPSKWPSPRATDSACNHLRADAHLDVVVSEVVDVVVSEVVEKKSRKRSDSTEVLRPDDVDEQVWNDWLLLRKRKKAPVTETVLSEAISEAAKAGLTVNRFLAVWCIRGSQGLQAEWLRPDERATGETAYQRSMRERAAEMHPAIARAAPGAVKPNPMEILDGLTNVRRLAG